MRWKQRTFYLTNLKNFQNDCSFRLFISQSKLLNVQFFSKAFAPSPPQRFECLFVDRKFELSISLSKLPIDRSDDTTIKASKHEVFLGSFRAISTAKLSASPRFSRSRESQSYREYHRRPRQMRPASSTRKTCAAISFDVPFEDTCWRGWDRSTVQGSTCCACATPTCSRCWFLSWRVYTEVEMNEKIERIRNAVLKNQSKS